MSERKGRKKTAWLDVDTQRDFMVPEGALYVRGARAIARDIRRLVAHAARSGIQVFSTTDAHTPDDPEFDDFPPHCVKGTWGQEKIPGTILRNRIIVPVEPKLSQQGIERTVSYDQVILEKVHYDVFTSPNAEAVVRASGARRFVVFGVATDFCVRGAVLTLRKMDYPVTVVEDVIRGVDRQATDEALDEMRQAGARFKTVDQVLG
ncbi:MAG: cysteine hydrolase family protein [Candidatus Brocadiia bacterium]